MDESYTDYMNAMNRIEYLESLLRVISETELSVDRNMNGDPVIIRQLLVNTIGGLGDIARKGLV